MNVSNLCKTAIIAAMLGTGAVATAGNAQAQASFRFDYSDYDRYDRNGRYTTRECNRFGDCYTVTCNRAGRNCYRSNYYRSGYDNYRPGRYYVCDRFNRCAYTPYPRTYYQRNPRAGFSFGFSF